MQLHFMNKLDFAKAQKHFRSIRIHYQAEARIYRNSHF